MIDRNTMACNCGCGFDTVDFDLAMIIADLEDEFNSAWEGNSGCRCREHNEKVQKEANPDYTPYSSNSFHMKGQADDGNLITNEKIHQGPIVSYKKVDLKRIYHYLCYKYSDKYGFGLYEDHIHIDSGLRKWRSHEIQKS